MKTIKFLSFGLLLFILAGCNQGIQTKDNQHITNTSNLDHTKTVQKLTNPETRHLEYTNNGMEISIAYPFYSYKPIDDILATEMKGVYAKQKDNFANLLNDNSGADITDSKFTFKRELADSTITKKFVSLVFNSYTYTRGAHGFPSTCTLNYNLNKHRLMTIDDVMKEHQTNLSALADLVANKLLTGDEYAKYRSNPVSERFRKMVYADTRPIHNNYETFSLTANSIIIYDKYDGFLAESSGVTATEITWDEVKDYMQNKNAEKQKHQIDTGLIKTINPTFGDTIKPMKNTDYINKQYGFSLSLPRKWKDNFVVYQLDNSNIKGPKEPDALISFAMVHNGKFIGSLFVIEVYTNITAEELAGYYESSGFEQFFAFGNQVHLVVSTIEELPSQLYEEDYTDLAEPFTNMARSYPHILETIEFQ